MTRLPTELRDVRGVDGPEYQLNIVCAAPRCSAPAQDPHHLWRRSEIGGDYAWVVSSAWEGKLSNIVGLCRDHHHQLTVNSSWLTYDVAENAFFWNTLMLPPALLEWTPLRESEAELLVPDENPTEERKSDDSTFCPTCKRALPHRHDGPREPRRPRRTWSITVPKDERENGAEILDTLLEEAREEMAKAGLPYGDTEAARYFVLSTALGLFVQHAEETLSDG